jgi:hypothetical protein
VKKNLEHTPTPELQEAVDLALGGDWQAAHEIAQEHEGNEVANWLHAVVHRMEGDLGNAGYWYRRCGRELHEETSTREELLAIKQTLAGSS